MDVIKTMRVDDERNLITYRIWSETTWNCSLTFECVSPNGWDCTKWAVAIQRVVALCVLLPSGRKKKNRITFLGKTSKKKNKTKLKDTNSLSEGSLRIVNERAQFSGGKKRRDNLCHAKVAASTENDNDYNSIRVLCIPEEGKTLSISYF